MITVGKLNKKIALVSGAARGIGYAISEELLKEGATVILTDLENEIELVNISENNNAIKKPLDISKITDWNSMVEFIDKEFGRLDILVNNAGIGGKEGIMDTSIGQWNKIINVNLTGAFIGMKKMKSFLKNVPSSSIINISSIYGKIGNGEAAAYHAAKAGLVGLTKTAAVELAPDFIRVNTVHPGVIETPMIKRKFEDSSIKRSLEEYTLLPRLGKPEDVAKSVVFLGSDDSQFITGTELVVDGGYLTH